MKKHLRMDGIKVFDEDAELLHLVMQELQTKNKSEAWRLVLHEYCKSKNIIQSFAEVKDEFSATKDEIAKLKEVIEDLYFVVQTMNKGQRS